MKFVVAQIGARRHYAVPALLETVGMLERFYTDLAGNVGLGRLASAAAGFARSSGWLKRLADRRVPDVIAEKTYTFAGPGLLYTLDRTFGRHDPARQFVSSLKYSQALGRAMARKGFGNATHVYSMLGECGPLLGAAKERGLVVISEVYICLGTEKILEDERRRFPGWEPAMPDYAALRRERVVTDYLFEYSDHFICPSQKVRDDLLVNCGVKPDRTAVVPYGASSVYLAIENRPVRGRVLFAGTAELRKGIHYLAMAAEKLLTKYGPSLTFQIAGDVAETVRAQPICRQLQFLGRIPRSEMTQQYARADVVVLPTLAEGSAGVAYEALAAGVPVITTPAAGSVIRDGIEGRIVPERDPEALAAAIEEITGDREKRHRMARAARVHATQFTWEKYSDRLVRALTSLQ